MTPRMLPLPLALLGAATLGAATLGAAPPAFELLPLGVYGGGYEGNLTSFALRAAGEERFRLLIDGGSLAGGILRWTFPGSKAGEVPPGAAARAVDDFVLGLETALLTHAHLDHLGGLVIQSPTFFARKQPLAVRGPGHAMATLGGDVFSGDLWGDFVSMGRVTLSTATPGTPFEAAGFQVLPLPLDHPVPALGYRFQTPEGAAFIHLGDTGPTTGELAEARRLLAGGQLRALSLECSFASPKHELAKATGHLTPTTLVQHLRGLVDPAREGDESPLRDADLERIAEALEGVLVIVQHIKPGDEAAVRRELARFQLRRLPLVVARQGELLRF